VTIHATTTSGALVVAKELMVSDDPLAQVPVNPPLASRAGPGVKDCVVVVLAVPVVVARFSHLPGQEPVVVPPR